MAILGDTKAVSLTLLDGVIGDLNPKTNNVYNLGTSSLKWKINGGGTTSQFLRGDGTWATPPNTTYNFSGTTFYSGSANEAEHNANNILKNGNYYYSSNGPATTLGASTGDGALYAQSYNDSWVGQIAQDYRDGQLFVRGKNNGTWKDWYAIPKFTTTTGGLGGASQPVYINTDGNLVAANSYPTSLPASDVSAWAKASTKPSYALSEITGADDVKAIEALTGTSGLLKKTAANTWALDTTSYLPLSGGTMTGQIKTSFKSSIAMGTYNSSATTIPDLIAEVRYSSGVGGSANITEAYTLNNVTIGASWYNFLYIPHRSGGLNGAANGDNCNYGILYLHNMTSSTNGDFKISFGNSNICLLRMDAQFIAAPTSGQVVITDGTKGGIKSSGFTIGKSVPSDAIFTDTNKYHKTGSWSGLTYTATAVNNADELKFTVPSATTSAAGAMAMSGTNLNTMINQLSTGSSTPVDADYYISQYVGGGTTTTTYHRRPMSALWTYIKEKITAGTYWANIKISDAAKYNAAPEMATLKLNGNTSASAASTSNVSLVYDSTLQALNFVFA